MNKVSKSIALAASLALLSGCAGQVTRQESGAVMGAVVGGVVGNQIGGGQGKNLATVLGVIAGSMAGASIGQSLDRQDELYAQRALEYNQTNKPAEWHNPDEDHDVIFTPTRTFQSSDGRYCREYQTVIKVGGKSEKGYGTACRQPDGSWKMVNR